MSSSPNSIFKVGVSDKPMSRSVYFYSRGVFNPFLYPRPLNNFTCFNYNKPFNAAYKPGTANGSVGTSAAASRAMSKRV
jgi:hypothetical protein